MRLLKFNNSLPQTNNFANHFYGNDPLNEMAFFTGGQRLNTPKVNIRESDDSYFIQVAAPGYSKKDFSIEKEYIDHPIEISSPAFSL